MRHLKTIQTKNKLNEVYALGDKGPGGAYHSYIVVKPGEENEMLCKIDFQKGARKDENAQQGVTDSNLLEIVRDRMKSFQEEEFACEYNEKALEHIEEALYWLNQRVEDRAKRNVLGTYEK